LTVVTVFRIFTNVRVSTAIKGIAVNQAFAREPNRQAFANRMHEVVEQLTESADPSTIHETLGMASGLSALTVAIERATVQGASLRDPLSAARTRGIGSREALIDKAGGLLRLAEAAEKLGITTQAVSGRRNRGTILAVPMPNGEWVYPVCQFTDHGLIPGLGDVLGAFRDITHWTQLRVLLARSERFGGQTALDLLQNGNKNAALSIAATYGEQG
jgi:hypothetical protein